MTTLLIIHSTVDGQTKKICRSIANHIQKKAPQAMVLQKTVGACTLEDIQHSDIVILGASIRYGKHRNNVYQFIEQYRNQLDAKISCFFSVNLVARKAGKDTATTNSYVIKFLEQTNWQPNEVDVFAGKLDYARYRFFDKLMIKFIMWMTKGPTHSDKPIEFTDWRRVLAFTDRIIKHIKVDDITANAPVTEPNQNTQLNSLTPDSSTEAHADTNPLNESEAHFANQITAQSTPTRDVQIVCAHCHTTNRVPRSKLAESPTCGKCKERVFSLEPIVLTRNVKKHTQTNQVLTIVDFWASWCQPCQQMAPQFANASKRLPQVVFAKLQTDKYKRASQPYNIRSLPTLVAFKNGVEIGRQSGVMSTSRIIQWVESLDETIKAR